MDIKFAIGTVFTTVIVKVVSVLIIAKIVLNFGNFIIEKVLGSRKSKGIPIDKKKSDTLISILKSIFRYLVYFISIVTILKIFGIPTESIIATAGIGGLAIGFGAQHLVSDIISGFFILFEEQFSVGDYITTSGVSGIVEEIGLRVSKVRDFSGDLHIIPNGKIEMVTNHTRGNMRALVDVTVAYEEDIDEVIKILKQTCEEIKLALSDIIMEGPNVLGVAELGDSGVVIRVIAKTVPMEQWGVEREIRRKIKAAFDREGIEIPYPRRVIISKNEDKTGV